MFVMMCCILWFWDMACSLIHYSCLQAYDTSPLRMLHLRLFVDTSKYKLEAYWSRCHVGIRRIEDGKHTWLGTHVDIRKNIEAANFVASLPHLSSRNLFIKMHMLCVIWHWLISKNTIFSFSCHPDAAPLEAQYLSERSFENRLGQELADGVENFFHGWRST